MQADIMLQGWYIYVMLLKNHLNHSLHLCALLAGRTGSSSPPLAMTGTAECGHDALCSHHYCIKERHFDQQTKRYGGTKMVRNKRDKHIQMLTVKLPRQPGNINIVSVFFWCNDLHGILVGDRVQLIIVFILFQTKSLKWCNGLHVVLIADRVLLTWICHTIVPTLNHPSSTRQTLEYRRLQTVIWNN